MQEKAHTFGAVLNINNFNITRTNMRLFSNSNDSTRPIPQRDAAGLAETHISRPITYLNILILYPL